MSKALGISVLAAFIMAVDSVAMDSPHVSIVSEADSASTHALPMMDVFVFVSVETPEPVGKMNLRVEYDADGITFLGAEAVNELAEWDHFTWRHAPQADCGDSCRSTLLILAKADIDEADSISPNPMSLLLDGHVVRMRFRTSNNLNLLNACPEISWLDASCADLTLSSVTGDTVYVSSNWPAFCETYPGATIVPAITAASGRVCIYDPDGKGDINLDARINEVGDFVLFNRYMIYGEDVLEPLWYEIQLINLDTNDDGLIGTVSDLRYLLRTIAAGTRFSTGGYYK